MPHTTVSGACCCSIMCRNRTDTHSGFHLPCNLLIAISVAPIDWPTEAGQLQAVEAAYQMGFDTYWLDAAWFPGGFPNGAGNWFTKRKEFPNGLKPVSDLCHKYRMQFVVWFEPCRVAPGTQIAREHPEFVLGGGRRRAF